MEGACWICEHILCDNVQYVGLNNLLRVYLTTQNRKEIRTTVLGVVFVLVIFKMSRSNQNAKHGMHIQEQRKL